jgi:hypothetical protein
MPSSLWNGRTTKDRFPTHCLSWTGGVARSAGVVVQEISAFAAEEDGEENLKSDDSRISKPKLQDLKLDSKSNGSPV